MLRSTMADPRLYPAPNSSPLDVLRGSLKRLHRESGEPSTREIARRTGRVISHTTVSLVLQCRKNPRWQLLEIIVQALDGDVEEFRQLWISVRDSEDDQDDHKASPKANRPAQHEAYGARPIDLTAHSSLHSGSVWTVAYDYHSGILAASGDSDSVWMWTDPIGDPTGYSITTNDSSVIGLAFNPKYKLFTTAGDVNISQWEPESATSIGRPISAPSTDYIQCMAYHPNGQLIAAGDQGGNLHLWDKDDDYRFDKPIACHTKIVSALAFHPYGHLLATGGYDGHVRLWDPYTRLPVGDSLEGYADSIEAITFHPDGHLLAAAGSSETVWFWNTETWRLTAPALSDHKRSVVGLAFHPDGHMIATGDTAGTIRFWDVTTGQLVGSPLQERSSQINSLVFHPSGNFLASGDDDGAVILWELEAGYPASEVRLREQIRLARSYASCVSAGQAYHTNSADRSPISTGVTRSRRLERIRMQGDDSSRATFACLPLMSGSLRARGMTLDVDSYILAGVLDDRSVQLWDIVDGTPIADPLPPNPAKVSAIGLQAERNLIVVGGDDGTVCVWDLSTESLITNPSIGHVKSITAISFTSNGEAFITGGSDGAVRQWDAISGLPNAPSMAHSGSVDAIAVHPNGSLYVTGGSDGTIRVWNTENPSSDRGPKLAHTGSVQAMAFRPDGVYSLPATARAQSCCGIHLHGRSLIRLLKAAIRACVL
ncbi:WD40 repeat domain-containing protein [Nonomuraea wenchangensis]